mmetsp:Transcript_46526/g.134703  ORF Transcript_46526/g.134703 Transcript_46526/m.134703 type:complete len:569 (-) Transcript_46526:281-1987(-)
MAGEGEAATEEAAAKEETAADEELQEYDEGQIEPIASNSLGFFDGEKFYLRSFAVWYRWSALQYQQSYAAFTHDKPESGYVNGVYFDQSMGRIDLWYDLSNSKHAELQEKDIAVDMSCWEIFVFTSHDGKPGKRSGKKIDGLTGETLKDIRRKYSWWKVFEDGESEFPGRWLFMSLAKVEHKPWASIWFSSSMNFHKKQVFGWTHQTVSYQLMKLLKSEEENLASMPPGEPQDLNKAMTTGVLPEQLCTGIDDDVDETEDQISVLIHFDERTLEFATGMVPLEELFSADVEPSRLDVYLRYDGLGLCSGQLVGRCIPERTTWEVVNVRRKLPKDTTIKAPAYYNQALRIVLWKAPGHQMNWEHAFADLQMPQCEPPKEREPWAKLVQRALVLSPAGPFSATLKTERAQKLITYIECSQDSVSNKAFIMLHLEEKLAEMFGRYQVDHLTFFSIKVGDSMLEVNAVADAEFRMCVGRLGGKCVYDKTTFELAMERNSPDDEREHPCLRVTVMKAESSRGNWDEVFTRLEAWQLNENMHQSLLDDPPDGSKVKSQINNEANSEAIEATETE